MSTRPPHPSAAPTSALPTTAYSPRHPSTSRFEVLRSLRYHLRCWLPPAGAAAAPPLVLLHGWMDVGASFQFLVDALHDAGAADRLIVAPDWRGYGLTAGPAVDSYWFPDYLADLDAVLHRIAPGQTVDLLGHSMGGNVAMLYAGLRPERVRRLVNVEGFGMPDAPSELAPKRLVQWLDELEAPMRLRAYDSVDGVAARLLANDPLLDPARAAWLAPHWSQPDADGHWALLADPAHKRVNPVLYRKDEVLAVWRQIRAPMLWVEGDRSHPEQWWGGRYSRAEFEARLATVAGVERLHLAPSGHMVHHDQAEALAAGLADFLRAV